MEGNGLDGYEYNNFMPEGQSQWEPWGSEETGELNISLQMSMRQCHLILCVGISQAPEGSIPQAHVGSGIHSMDTQLSGLNGGHNLEM